MTVTDFKKSLYILISLFLSMIFIIFVTKVLPISDYMVTQIIFWVYILASIIMFAATTVLVLDNNYLLVYSGIFNFGIFLLIFNLINPVVYYGRIEEIRAPEIFIYSFIVWLIFFIFKMYRLWNIK